MNLGAKVYLISKDKGAIETRITAIGQRAVIVAARLEGRQRQWFIWHEDLATVRQEGAEWLETPLTKARSV